MTRLTDDLVVPGVELVRRIIPAGRRTRPGHAIRGPRWVTVHDTGNPAAGADALAHGRLFAETATNEVAYHLTVDDRRAVLHLPLGEMAWHAGDGASGPGNRESWAVAIAQNEGGNRAAAEDNAARVVAALLRLAKLSVGQVRQHADWRPRSGCPAILRARPGGWEGFLAAVSRHLEANAPDARDAVIEELRRELAAAQADLADARARLQQISILARGEV